MNNKGFIFIETIITTVVLTTTLLFLYISYSNAIIVEKERLYFDNVSYVYKTLFARNILMETINFTNFNEAKENFFDESIAGEDYMYKAYFFGPDSAIPGTATKIYNSNLMVKDVNNLYNINAFVHLPIEDIGDVKYCLRLNKAELNENIDCKQLIDRYVDFYGGVSFRDYLLTLDVDESLLKSDGSRYNSILISIFRENKAGASYFTNGSYEACIQSKVRSYPSLFEGSEDMDKINKYYKQDKISFDMQCQNAYYFAWVYFL